MKIIPLLLLIVISKLCTAQSAFVITDSTTLHCNYKISFLNRTIEEGWKISYYNDATKDSFLTGDMGSFVSDTLLNFTAAEVTVQSCDGKKKYEVTQTLLEYFIYNDGSVTPLSYPTEGAFINLKEILTDNKNGFEKLTITLKGVEEKIYLSIWMAAH